MKNILKPAEVLRRYHTIERRQSIAYILFILAVAAFLLLHRLGIESGVAAVLLVAALAALALSYFRIRRCPVCGTLLSTWPARFNLPIECPHCSTSFTTGRIPGRTLCEKSG